jgi:hypothetical protein
VQTSGREHRSDDVVEWLVDRELAELFLTEVERDEPVMAVALDIVEIEFEASPN